MGGQNVQMCFDGLSALAAELPLMGKLPCDGSATCRGLPCSGVRGRAPGSARAALAWGEGITCLESFLKC